MFTNEKEIEKVTVNGRGTIRQLIDALERLTASSTFVTNRDGDYARTLHLFEETLTDGSVVNRVEIRFK